MKKNVSDRLWVFDIFFFHPEIGINQIQNGNRIASQTKIDAFKQKYVCVTDLVMTICYWSKNFHKEIRSNTRGIYFIFIIFFILLLLLYFIRYIFIIIFYYYFYYIFYAAIDYNV